MLNYEGKIYRNLEEQVKYNAESISQLEETTVKLDDSINIISDGAIDLITSGTITVPVGQIGNPHIPLIISYSDKSRTVDRILYFTQKSRAIPRGFPSYIYVSPILGDNAKIILTATATIVPNEYDYTIEVEKS